MIMKKIFILALVIFLNMGMFAQTEVSGNQYGTWDASGSPYLVTGEVTVPAGETLNIGAGVTVEFQGHYKLTVNGTLIASGSEQDSIFFTAADPETGWHGVRLTESQSGSRFAYCRFEYGKTSSNEFPDQHGGAIMMNNSNAVIDHCLFINNEAVADDNGMGGAIYGINTTSDLEISNCTFISNYTYGEGGAVKLTGDTGAKIDSCIFLNNTVLYGGGAICLYGCYDTYIYRCLFNGNVTSYASGGAVFIEGYSARVRFVNCTMFDNHATGGDGGGVDIAFSDASFTNSIIYNNPGAYSSNIYLDMGYAEVNYCDTPFPDGAEGDNNINTNAGFIDEYNGDFHLLSSSPCIDAGIDSLTITDAFGETFTVVDFDPSDYSGNAPDMGCYEFDPFTGIRQQVFENAGFYPNPTTGMLYFNIPDKQINRLSVSDLSGKIMMKEYRVSNHYIDLSGLERGVYVVYIKTKDKVYSGKVVKE